LFAPNSERPHKHKNRAEPKPRPTIERQDMKDDKNPYDSETPEWQLWENMTSSARQSLAYAADAERYTKLSQAAREKSEKYRLALARLEKKI
jgi:hypothetical protein